MPAQTLRLGAIGLGRAAATMLPSLIAHPHVRLTAAADPNPAARARFPTNVTLFGYTLSMGMELAIVVVFAVVFFVLAFRGLSKTE